MLDGDKEFSDGELRLSRLARRSALRGAPAFSEVRHARIMRAIDQHPTTKPARTVAALRHPWLVPAALAACLAIIATPIGPRPGANRGLPGSVAVGTRATRGTVNDANVPAVLVIDRTAHRVNAQVTDIVQTAMAEQQWGGLDHDVRSATQFLVDQVPLRSAWDGGNTNARSQ